MPVLVRGGGKEDLQSVLRKSAALLAQGACGLVYGRNIYQHENPKRVVAALMAMIHRGVSGDEAWEIYQQWLSPACCSASTPATPSSRRCCSTATGRQLAASQRNGASLDARRPAMSSATWRNSGATPPR